MSFTVRSVVVPRMLSADRVFLHLHFTLVDNTSSEKDIIDWPKTLYEHMKSGRVFLKCVSEAGETVKRTLESAVDPGFGKHVWTAANASSLWARLFSFCEVANISREAEESNSNPPYLTSLGGEAIADLVIQNAASLEANPSLASDLRPGFRLFSTDTMSEALLAAISQSARSNSRGIAGLDDGRKLRGRQVVSELKSTEVMVEGGRHRDKSRLSSVPQRRKDTISRSSVFAMAERHPGIRRRLGLTFYCSAKCNGELLNILKAGYCLVGFEELNYKTISPFTAVELAVAPELFRARPLFPETFYCGDESARRLNTMPRRLYQPTQEDFVSRSISEQAENANATDMPRLTDTVNFVFTPLITPVQTEDVKDNRERRTPYVGTVADATIMRLRRSKQILDAFSHLRKDEHVVEGAVKEALYAEDLITGHTIHVRKQVNQPWRSLCRRMVRLCHKLESGATEILCEFEEEAEIESSIAVAMEQTTGKLKEIPTSDEVTFFVRVKKNNDVRTQFKKHVRLKNTLFESNAFKAPDKSYLNADDSILVTTGKDRDAEVVKLFPLLKADIKVPSNSAPIIAAHVALKHRKVNLLPQSDAVWIDEAGNNWTDFGGKSPEFVVEGEGIEVLNSAPTGLQLLNTRFTLFDYAASAEKPLLMDADAIVAMPGVPFGVLRIRHLKHYFGTDALLSRDTLCRVIDLPRCATQPIKYVIVCESQFLEYHHGRVTDIRLTFTNAVVTLWDKQRKFLQLDAIDDVVKGGAIYYDTEADIPLNASVVTGCAVLRKDKYVIVGRLAAGPSASAKFGWLLKTDGYDASFTFEGLRNQERVDGIDCHPSNALGLVLDVIAKRPSREVAVGIHCPQFTIGTYIPNADGGNRGIFVLPSGMKMPVEVAKDIKGKTGYGTIVSVPSTLMGHPSSTLISIHETNIPIVGEVSSMYVDRLKRAYTLSVTAFGGQLIACEVRGVDVELCKNDGSLAADQLEFIEIGSFLFGSGHLSPKGDVELPLKHDTNQLETTRGFLVGEFKRAELSVYREFQLDGLFPLNYESLIEKRQYIVWSPVAISGILKKHIAASTHRIAVSRFLQNFVIDPSALDSDTRVSVSATVSESLARWGGWSMVVEQPGRSVEGSTNQRSKFFVERFLPRLDKLAANEREMWRIPALRFGQDYEFAVRRSDIAGNLAYDEPLKTEYAGKHLGRLVHKIAAAFSRVTTSDVPPNIAQ